MNKQTVTGIFVQHLQTIHPDHASMVCFEYTATVDENEDVEILKCYAVLNGMEVEVRINEKSEYDTSMKYFIANIREHARVQAYNQNKREAYAKNVFYNEQVK